MDKKSGMERLLSTPIALNDENYITQLQLNSPVFECKHGDPEVLVSSLGYAMDVYASGQPEGC